MDKQFPMTVEGKQALEAELENLIKIEREEVKRILAEARALGDLRENSEYHAAKERQSLIEGRVLEIQYRLGKAIVINTALLSGSKIVFGATVVLYRNDTEESLTYKIVGIDEADSKQAKISFSSPLAKALIGKEEGDSITVDAPKGRIEYEIHEVIYE